MRYHFMAVLLLLCVCANQMPPSGGPDDTRPPAVVRTVPANAAVGQTDLTEITLEFSEWVDPRAAKRSIAVFPPVAEGFEVGVRGRKVTVKPVGPLADSTTYHIVISTGLEDLHRVSIGTPYHLVFSTGSRLDSGTVFGCVFDREARRRQPKIALHACPGDVSVDSALLAPPTYMAQTDSTGRFILDYIRKGTYAVAGFIDRDGNGRLGLGIEDAFAPATRLITVDSVTGPLELFGVGADTSTIRITSLKAHSPRLLIGHRGQSDTKEPVALDTTWRLEPTDSTLVSPGIDTVMLLDDAGRFAVRLSDTLTAAGYRLIYRPVRRPRPDPAADTLRDTVRFNGIVTADTIAPVLTRAIPRGVVGLMPVLGLQWSEPVRCLSATWPLIDSTADTVQLAIDTAFGDTVTMKPRRRLLPGTRYTLAIPPDRFEDLGGNHPVDTADTPRVSLSFSTMIADSICLSLSGQAACTTGFTDGIWLFTPLAAHMPAVTTADSGGAFTFDSIPGGRGNLALFDDLDGDGRHTGGTLFPWRAPEPLYAFDDTVEARARWDIEGIMVDNCELCTKRPEPAASKPQEPKK
jgi:hypothetical protein